MNATNNAVKYGLEILKSSQEVFSLGLNNSHNDATIIIIPPEMAVTK